MNKSKQKTNKKPRQISKNHILLELFSIFSSLCFQVSYIYVLFCLANYSSCFPSVTLKSDQTILTHGVLMNDISLTNHIYLRHLVYVCEAFSERSLGFTLTQTNKYICF